MSRSYKKTGAYAIAGGSDKWNRTRYHRDERRKVKSLLHEQLAYGTSIWKPVEGTCCLYGDVCNVDDWWCDDPSKYIINYEEDSTPKEDLDHDCFMCRFSYWNKDYDCSEEPWEKIVMNKVDRTIPSGDKYCWASDGGSYWRHNKETIRKEFDKEVFCNRDCWYSKPINIWDEYVDYVERKLNEKAPTMSIRVAKAISISTRYSWFEHKEVECVKYDYKVIKTSYNKEHQFDTSLIPEGYQVDCIWKTRGRGFSGTNKWEEIQWNMIPLDFKTPEELINWLRNNQERMINTVWKRRYGK